MGDDPDPGPDGSCAEGVEGPADDPQGASEEAIDEGAIPAKEAVDEGREVDKGGDDCEVGDEVGGGL